MKNNELISLTSIRGLACIMVFLGHADSQKLFFRSGGAEKLGVMLFFALSGFLMVYHYRDVTNYKKYKRFLTIRFFRIYPAYALSVLVTGLLLYLGLTYAGGGLTGFNALNHLVFIDGIYIYWTTRVEAIFYLFFPFMMITFLFFEKRHQSFLVLIILSALWLASCNGFWLLTHNQIFSDFMTALPYLICGMIAAYVYMEVSRFYDYFCKYINAAFYLLLAIFLVCVPSIRSYLFGYSEIYWENGVHHFNWALSLLAGLMILIAALSCHGTSPVLRYHWLILIGQISYTIYLFHRIILRGVSDVLHQLNMHYMMLGLALSIMITIVICYPIYIFYEKRFSQLGKRLANPKTAEKQTS